MSHYDDDSLPIWLCIIRQEPIRNQIGCIRIIKAVKGTLGDSEAFYNKNRDLLSHYGHGIICQVMYFHREPDESPLKEEEE